ncbi:MAG: translation initiation factor IF-3, partial [Candidatus Thiodiazotropha sp.]
RFLEDGDKTKVTMRFRGREHALRELGLELLERVERDLSDYGQIEQKPVMEGRQMVMVLGPKKK